MAPERLERVALYESREIVPLSVKSPGVYDFPLQVEGNSILSSLMVTNVGTGGTIKVSYFDVTTGYDIGEESPLDEHPLISAPTFPTVNKILVTRVHNKPVIRITITGDDVEFGIYITVISSFASELDSALVFDEQLANLLLDKGMVIAGYDPITNKFKFARLDPSGALVVSGVFSIGAEENETIKRVVCTNAGQEYSYTFPANTTSFMIKTLSGQDFEYAAASFAADNFLTLPVYAKSGIKAVASRTIYFRSDIAGEIMEISSWA